VRGAEEDLTAEALAALDQPRGSIAGHMHSQRSATAICT